MIQPQPDGNGDLREDVYGYFDGRNPSPTHDPGPDGLCAICATPLCSKPADGVKTISLAYVDAGRSYFYRCHRSCYESITQAERDLLDLPVLNSSAARASAPSNGAEQEGKT